MTRKQRAMRKRTIARKRKARQEAEIERLSITLKVLGEQPPRLYTADGRLAKLRPCETNIAYLRRRVEMRREALAHDARRDA